MLGTRPYLRVEITIDTTSVARWRRYRLPVHERIQCTRGPGQAVARGKGLCADRAAAVLGAAATTTSTPGRMRSTAATTPRRRRDEGSGRRARCYSMNARPPGGEDGLLLPDLGGDGRERRQRQCRRGSPPLRL